MPPPRLATRLLRLAAPPEDADYVVEDLAEEFDVIARERGPGAAARWFWGQTAASLAPLAAARGRAAWAAAGDLAAALTRGTMVRPNIKYTLRMLARAPGMASVIVLTLGLGIGANTAVFSVVDAVLLRPLPYATPEELVAVWQTSPKRPRATVSAGDLGDYRAGSRSFADLAGYASSALTLTGAGPTEALPGEVVDTNLFAVLGVQPALGRGFTEADGRPGAAPVAILSHALWRSRFNGDAAILGRALTLNGDAHTVVGVMPAAFQGLYDFSAQSPTEVFVPAVLDDEARASREHAIRVVGRLRPGVSLEDAQADLERLAAGIAQRFPESHRDIRPATARLDRDIVRNVRTSILVAFGAVAVVALLACVNVANLLVAWSVAERREVAIRLALGASRADVMVDIVMRGLCLGALGGTAGLLSGIWARNMLVSLAPASFPRLEGLAMNGRVLLATAILAAIAGLAAGVIPALQSVRRSVAPSLRSTELSASGTRSVMRWRGAMLTIEVAAAVMLAIGAGLVVKSLMRLNGVGLGFQTGRVLTMTIRPQTNRYPDKAAQLRFFEALAERVRTIPGVEVAAFANQFPLRGGWGGGLLVETPSGPVEGEADLQAVSPDYFTALGMPAVRGRLLAAGDRLDSEPVAVVSQAFASRFVPGQDPIGLRLRRTSAHPPITIVGVVGDVRRDGKLAEVTPQVYLSASQIPLYAVELSALAVRTSVEPRSVVAPLRAIVSSMDPELPVSNVRTLDEIVAASIATRRFNSWLLSSFALLALVLAVAGVYGVATHMATQRTQEIGIRVALGATRLQVTGLVVAGGLRWTAAGIAIGLAAAALVSKVLTSLLFGITATDPSTFAAVGLAVLGVALAASFVPARRAAAANPVAALRGE